MQDARDDKEHQALEHGMNTEMVPSEFNGPE
jgi:hypothetical protein